MSDVTLYTTDFCSKCTGAKSLLAKRGISYHEINLAKDPDGRGTLERTTGHFTFPQIVISGRSIGGFEELVALDRSGRLSQLLAA